MAIDYVALKTEIDTDPQTIGVSPSKTDVENADLLNQVGLSGESIAVPVNIISYLQWLASTAIYDNLESQKGIHADKGIRSICHAALKMIDVADLHEIDIRDPINVGMVDALVAGGVVTAAQKTDLYDVQSMRTASRAEILFGMNTVVHHSDVAVAYGRV